jgi:hypothetical protein
MSFPLNDLDTGQLLVSVNALAVSFSKGLTAAEIDLLSSFIVSIGDLLALIAIKQATKEESLENNQNKK